MICRHRHEWPLEILRHCGGTDLRIAFGKEYGAASFDFAFPPPHLNTGCRESVTESGGWCRCFWPPSSLDAKTRLWLQTPTLPLATSKPTILQNSE